MTTKTERKMIAGLVAFLAVLAVVVRFERRPAPDAQAKLFDAILDAHEIASGIPRKAEIAATTEDQARKIARETLHWGDRGFSVRPKVKDYLTVRFIEVTP